MLRQKQALTWHLLLEVDAPLPQRDEAVKQTVSVIERRLDGANVHSFTVVAQGTPPNGQILVNLPDVADRERLTKLITSGGLLELVSVVSPPNPAPVQIHPSREAALASLGSAVPENRRVLPYLDRSDPLRDEQSPSANPQPSEWVVVETPAIVSGPDLRNALAAPSRISSDGYLIHFSLKPEGADRFATWTGAHINSYLGVVLNGDVKSIVYIKSQIGDQGEIAGRFTKLQAEDLALALRTGALPAPLKIVRVGNNEK